MSVYRSKRKIALLILSFLMPFASFATSMFLIRANDDTVVPEKSSASSEQGTWTEIAKDVRLKASEPNNKGEWAKLVVLNDEQLIMVYSDMNNYSDPDRGWIPWLKMISHNVTTGETTPPKVIGGSAGVSSVMPFEFVYGQNYADKNPIMGFAVGHSFGGGISMYYADGSSAVPEEQVKATKKDSPSYAKDPSYWFHGCIWGQPNCGWGDDVSFYGYYSHKDDPAYTDNPKYYYKQGDRVNGNKNWTNSGKVYDNNPNNPIRNYHGWTAFGSREDPYGTGILIGSKKQIWAFNKKTQKIEIRQLYNDWRVEDAKTISGNVNNFKLPAGAKLQKGVTNELSEFYLHPDKSKPIVYATGEFIEQGRGWPLSDALHKKGKLYAFNYQTRSQLGEAIDLSNLSEYSSPSNLAVIGNKIYFTSGSDNANHRAELNMKQGIYSCDLDDSGKPINGSCVLDTVPEYFGNSKGIKINSLKVAKGRLFAAVSNANDLYAYLYEYTPPGGTPVGIGNGVGIAPATSPTAGTVPTGNPITTPGTTVPTAGTAPTPTCRNDPEPLLGSTTRTRINCNIDMNTGAIDVNSCSNTSQFTLKNNHAGFDQKTTTDLGSTTANGNKVWQTYLTKNIDGNQLRCYRMCDFSPSNGQVTSCPKDFSCRSVNSLRNSCGERYQSYSSYEFTTGGRDFTVMSYITVDQKNLVAQVCPFDKNTGNVADYKKCVLGTLPIDNLRGVGNESYKSYTSFMLNDKKLVQMYFGTNNKLYQHVCNISYSTPTDDGVTGINLKAESCSEFIELDVKDQSGTSLINQNTKIISTLEPYQRSDGSYRVSLYSF